MKDIVSEIIDQQVDPSELGEAINQVVRDRAACERWRNYHLIGDVIRGEVNTTGACMMNRLQRTMEQEPTVLAPVVDAERVDSKPNPDAWKSAGLFAVAASIALMAVLTLTPESSTLINEGSVIAKHDQASTEGVIAITDAQRQQQKFEAEFGQMLVEHGEFTATPGLNGLIAYAKMVSNENLDE
jgi:negative regulator of sigma E activity